MIPIDEPSFDTLAEEIRPDHDSVERPFWDVCDADDMVVDPWRVLVAVLIVMMIVTLIATLTR